MNDGLFSTPEKKVRFTGTVIPLLLVGVVVYFFGSSAGDFLTNALSNLLSFTMYGIAEIVVVGGVAYVLVDGTLRRLTFYLYKSIMRQITGAFVSIDPIGILKTYKEQTEDAQNNMGQSLDSLRGQLKKTSMAKSEKEKEFENEMYLVLEAKKKGDTRIEAREGKQVVRLQSAIKRQTETINQLTLLVNVMTRYSELCQDTIIDMDREIKAREEELEETKSSRTILNSAKRILNGGPEREMYDDAMDLLKSNYAQNLGEIEGFLAATKDVLSSADLQDGADASKAKQALDDWQKKNSGMSFGAAGNQQSKESIIQEAVNQISPGAKVLNDMLTSGNKKPEYVTVGKGNNDYLNMAGKR